MGGQQMIGIEGQVCVQLLCVWKVPSHIYLVSWARLSPVHLRSRIPAHHITEFWILSDPEDRGAPNIHDYPQKEPYPWNRWIVHLDSRAMKVSTWNYYDTCILIGSNCVEFFPLEWASSVQFIPHHISDPGNEVQTHTRHRWIYQNNFYLDHLTRYCSIILKIPRRKYDSV